MGGLETGVGKRACFFFFGSPSTHTTAYSSTKTKNTRESGLSSLDLNRFAVHLPQQGSVQIRQAGSGHLCGSRCRVGLAKRGETLVSLHAAPADGETRRQEGATHRIPEVPTREEKRKVESGQSQLVIFWNPSKPPHPLPHTLLGLTSSFPPLPCTSTKGDRERERLCDSWGLTSLQSAEAK